MQQLEFPHHILEIDGDAFGKISSDITKKFRLIICHGMKTVLHFTMFQSLHEA